MIKTGKEDRSLPATRLVAALVIPFLVVAFVILYLFPQDSKRLFAWGIQPAMTATMLGAAYAGGVYFFTAVLLTRRWHLVHVGFPPVITFASLLGIATILHWDRFTHDHVAFFAWAGLYFTTPFIVLAAWLRNRGQDPGRQDDRSDVAIPRPVRLALAALGLATLAVSALLFLLPSVVIGWWPWGLTPLTARVVSAMFALPGVVGLGIALDERWRAARIILQSQAFSIALILVAIVRARADLDWGNPLSWLFAGGLAAMLAGIGGLYAAMERRMRRQG